MAIPEAQLVTWSHQGSVTQSASTYQSIKQTLESVHASYAGKSFRVYLQGSYGNDTNVYAESDVDVVIELSTTFYHDVETLEPSQQQSFHANYHAATYSLYEFKNEVLTHLRSVYGQGVKAGDKAIFIPGSGNRRDADVIVAAEYRKYQGGSGNTYTQGICFWNSKGVQIINYPKLHSANGTSKHQATGSWYKPTVRVMKNLRRKLVADGRLEDGIAPSYFIESLIYNVPNDKFGYSFDSTMVDSINFLLTADRSKFEVVNEQYYLLHPTSPVTWRAEKCTAFLNAARHLWQNW